MQKIISYIGFAVRSNHIIKGLDDLQKTKKKVFVVVLANDLQESSQNKLKKYLEIKHIDSIKIENRELESLNLNGVKVLGITDQNLAQAIKNEYKKQLI